MIGLLSEKHSRPQSCDPCGQRHGSVALAKRIAALATGMSEKVFGGGVCLRYFLTFIFRLRVMIYISRHAIRAEVTKVLYPL